MKRFIVLLAITTLFMFVGCETKVETSDSKINKQQEQMLSEANRQVGMPAMVNYQEKKLLKSIYELRDQENYICYAYLCNELNGAVGQFLGKCIGYGIPYATQFSAPEKYSGVTTDKVADFAGRDWTYAYEMIPQAEPNGLFMPTSAEATWLLLIDPRTGTPHPVYVEPKLIISPFPLTPNEK